MSGEEMHEGPWGKIPEKATHFSVYRLEGGRSAQCWATVGEESLVSFPIELLSRAWVRQNFGPGRFKLRYRATGARGTQGQSAEFKLEPERKAHVPPKDKGGRAPAPASAPPLDPFEVYRAQQRAVDEHVQKALEREQQHHLRLEEARTAGRREVFEMMAFMRQNEPPPAPAPASAETPPWAARLLGTVETMAARIAALESAEYVGDDDDDDDDAGDVAGDDDDDAAPSAIAEAVTSRLTPLEHEIVGLVKEHGPSVLEFFRDMVKKKPDAPAPSPAPTNGASAGEGAFTGPAFGGMGDGTTHVPLDTLGRPS